MMPPQYDTRTGTSKDTCTDDVDRQEEQQQHETTTTTTTSSSSVPLIELELQNVSYTPIVKKGGRKNNNNNNSNRVTILNNISTKISPYQLTAWMGPSGSGKTSLISVAANLTGNDNNDSEIHGTILVNGEKGKLPKRLVGVVWQDDLLLCNLTVQENLYYAAKLKTPRDKNKTNSNNSSKSLVHTIVQDTINELGLSHVQDHIVGTIGQRGISGGERKRVAVGAELVVRPSLIFLDEPTSGLDATTALLLIQKLKDLCETKGHSIVVVIHQPRTTIYNLFDHLLLLSKGHVLYNGHPTKARTYLESCCNTLLPPETGIADWMMDIVTEDEKQNSSNNNNNNNNNMSALALKWSQQTDTSQFLANNNIVDHNDTTTQQQPRQRRQQQFVHDYSRRLSSLNELNESVPRYYTNFITQLILLTNRTMKQQRGERLTKTAFILQLTYLFFTILFWWRLRDDTSTIFERNSLLFFMLIAQANGIVIAAVTVFQRERTLLSRERAKKMYTVSSYFLAKTVSDMTNNVLLPLLYTMVVYWTANYRVSIIAYLKYIFTFYWTFSTAQSMGLFLSIFIPIPQMALVLAPPITLFFTIMGGFYIPFEKMHPGVQWISYLSFARYGYSALIINEYAGRDIPCDPDDDVNVSSSVSVSVVDGINNECPLPGEEILSRLGIYGVTENFWFNVSILIIMQIIFRISSYVLLRRSK